MEDVTSNMSIAVIMNHLACPEVDYEYWKNLFFGTFDIFGTFDGHWDDLLCQLELSSDNG